MDLLLSLSILANEFHLLAHTVDGEVASLCQCLEDVDLLTRDLIAARTGYFTEY